ncbi:uncharacterized protein F5147DRAFT_706915 [Suillus discolor]|uniref:Apple domain-containing protein n=1 Tax=Suillus discolor TaxID=1912936 RepID=A0A9P7F2K4_9AGAM|nr:uncharacterized protein F5147DRAFT_706915 [Suillus discolor]KAG2102829.1 hypothetical protein F5147DRAFT_706915 [Suillus discolor]
MTADVPRRWDWMFRWSRRSGYSAIETIMTHDIRGYWDSTGFQSLDPSQIVKRQSAGIPDVIELHVRLLADRFILSHIASSESHIMRFSSAIVLAIVAGLTASSSATPVEGSATDRCAEFCFSDGACAGYLVSMRSESCFCFHISAIQPLALTRELPVIS